MSNRNDREAKIPPQALEEQIRVLFEQIFRAGLVLGLRLRDLPERLKNDISAACGDVTRIEELIRTELERILSEAFSKLPQA
jgi:hypothetical protein